MWIHSAHKRGRGKRFGPARHARRVGRFVWVGLLLRFAIFDEAGSLYVLLAKREGVTRGVMWASAPPREGRGSVVEFASTPPIHRNAS